MSTLIEELRTRVLSRDELGQLLVLVYVTIGLAISAFGCGNGKPFVVSIGMLVCLLPLVAWFGVKHAYAE